MRDFVLGIVIGIVAVVGLAVALPVFAGAVAPTPDSLVGTHGSGPLAGMMDQEHTNVSQMHEECPMMDHNDHEHGQGGEHDHEAGEDHDDGNETHSHAATNNSASLAVGVAS